MDDLISRDALKKVIGKVYGCDWNYIEKYFHIAEAVNSLPSAEPESKWIPVTERIPNKESKSYWVCTNTKYQCECRWTNNIYGIGESNECGWSIFDIPQYTKVVAWMPLPKPYGGE